MAGEHFFVMQGTIHQATLYNELQSNIFSWSCFKKYFDNCRGDIGATFMAVTLFVCNDYSMPILWTSNFTNYLNASNHTFAPQWAFLSSHCNINQETGRDNLMDSKERQVFIAQLILQRMTNIQSLPNWCLIYQRPCTDGNKMSFMETNISWSYRDRFYSSLTSHIVETVIHLLFKRSACWWFYKTSNVVISWESNAEGDLTNSYSEQQRLHIVWIHFWTSHGFIKTIELTYCQDQIILSPLGMQSYEMIDLMLPTLSTDLLTNHQTTPISPEPCFIGAHMNKYEKAIHLCRHILSIRIQ